MKRFIKGLLLTIATLITIILISVAIALNFIFTPEKITPTIKTTAQGFLASEIDLKAVDLSFFSTFPHFQAQIDTLSLFAPQKFNDKKDSLFIVDRAIARINVMKLLIGQLDIEELTFTNPSIYGFIDRNGKPNWDILKVDTTQQVIEKNEQNDTTSFEFEDMWNYKVAIDKIAIENGKMIFNDRSTDLYLQVPHFNLSIQGELLSSESSLKVDFMLNDLLFWQEGKLLVKDLNLGLVTDLAVDREQQQMSLHQAMLKVNDINLACSGDINLINNEQQLDLDIQYGFNIPSLKNVLDQVPASILQQKNDVDVKGTAFIAGAIKGVYGQGEVPIITVDSRIENGYVAYADMPLKLEELEFKSNAYIDLSKKTESYIKIDTLLFKGGNSYVQLGAECKELLTDPYVISRLRTNLDLSTLTEIFPLSDSIICQGQFVSDLTAAFLIEDVQSGNYGRMYAKGHLGVDSIMIYIPQEDVRVEWKDAGIKFGDNRNKQTHKREFLNGVIGYSGLNLTYKDQFTMIMDTTFISFSTTPLKDTSSIATVSSKLVVGRSEIIVKDTLLLGVDRGEINLKLTPAEEDKKIPVISCSGMIRDIRTQYLVSNVSMKGAGISLQVKRDANDKKIWYPKGIFAIKQLEGYSPLFPLEVKIPATQITIDNDRISLDSALLQVGSSDLNLTGYLEDCGKWIFKQDTLKGRFNLTSKMLNINQLMQAMAAGERYAEQHTETPITLSTYQQESTIEVDSLIPVDTTATLFVVPKRMDLVLNTSLDQAVFGKLYMDSIQGKVVVRNQQISLGDLKMRSSAANMESSVVYRAKDLQEGYVGFKMDMYDIRIDSLVHLVPALDSLFPMLSSFEGSVNFQMAGETYLDSTFTVLLPTLKGGAHLEGKDLVLMDGETFAEISKMLMFKNKNRNMIDSVAVSLKVDNGEVDIFPFLIEIDRYRAAVGGQHNIDMTFNYHISILKSPLPFKAGVDIYGNLDDMKYKITKAKYKNLFLPTRKGKIDSTVIHLDQRLRKMLEEPTGDY